MNSVAIQTEVAYQSRALEWGQTLCGQRLRIWLLLDTHEAAAYEDKLAAQVRVLDEALDAEEARQLANASPYGLVAGLWTREIDTAHGLAARLNAGQRSLNTYFGGGVATPCGGDKKSGVGRATGLAALAHYTQVKNVCVALS